MQYWIAGIPTTQISDVRATLKSPQYGHPAHVDLANGYGPCRACLRTFEIGQEERILFTYNPFDGLSTYPLPGPVYIHREECARYESGLFPPGLRGLPIMVEGYGPERTLVAREQPAAKEVEQVLSRLFADPNVLYIHLRNAKAGCFIALVTRES